MNKSCVYTAIEDIKYDDISISFIQKNHKMTIIDVKYMYANISDKLYVSCNDIKLNYYNGITQKYDKYILNHDQKYQSNTIFINLIKSFRTYMIDYIIKKHNNIDLEYAEELKNKNIYLRIYPNTDIIKLGSNTEKNVNKKINTFDEFNEYIYDKTYNRYNTDRYYLANIILKFNISLYKNDNNTDKWKILFTPIIKNFEFKFNKSITNDNINKSTNIVIFNNTLSI